MNYRFILVIATFLLSVFGHEINNNIDRKDIADITVDQQFICDNDNYMVSKNDSDKKHKSKSDNKKKFNKKPKDTSLDDNIIRLTENNFIILRGEIDSLSASKFINEIIKFTSGDEVYIYIISGGGSVMSGMEIVRTIGSLIENDVTVNCIANTAMSMAFIIFQHCTNRYITDSSILMQHQMSISLKGPLRQVSTHLDLIYYIDKEMDIVQSNRLNISVEKFKGLTAHDWWLYGKDCIDKNVADKFVNVVCDFYPETKQETFYTFFGPAYVLFSTCPLARDPLKVTYANNNLNITEYEYINSKFDTSTYISNKMKGTDSGYSGYSFY